MKKNITKIVRKAPGILILYVSLHLTSPVMADGMDEPVRPSKKAARVEPRPEPPKEVIPMQQQVERHVDSVEPCDWKWRLSPGGTVWFFKDENNLFGPALYSDIWRTDSPINFRLGIEGRHMYLGQDAADFARESPEKTTRVTFIRIPFALEYMQAIGSRTTWFIGGGPDILHTANDLEDTSVGGHLGSRLHYALDKQWGVALEGGYMWGSVDGAADDVELDNAYVTPTISYTF